MKKWGMNTEHLKRELVEQVPKIVLWGDTCLLVENHGGVRDYRQDHLTFTTNIGSLAVGGEQLILTSYGKDDALISGLIRQVVWKETE